MSDNLSVPTLAKRKVMGVPVLYLVAAFVILLALYAWKSKKTVAPATTAAVDTTATTAAATGELFPAANVGTVVAANTPPVVATPNSSITTNEQWLAQGVAFLSKSGTSPGVSQLALQKYLTGAQLSFQEAALRDKVITELGMPPYLQTIYDPATDPIKSVPVAAATVPDAPAPTSYGFVSYYPSSGPVTPGAPGSGIFEIYSDGSKRAVRPGEPGVDAPRVFRDQDIARYPNAHA